MDLPGGDLATNIGADPPRAATGSGPALYGVTGDQVRADG